MLPLFVWGIIFIISLFVLVKAAGYFTDSAEKIGLYFGLPDFIVGVTIVAFGTSARVCQKAVEIARAKGLKVGLLRPITLFPFPKKAIQELARRAKGFLSVEMSAGQMVEDIKLSVYEAGSNARVNHFGRMGGIIPTPTEVVDALEDKFSWELSYGVKRSY